jgi:hypothetical protein
MLTFAKDFYEIKAEVLKILKEGNSKRREKSMKRNYLTVFKIIKFFGSKNICMIGRLRATARIFCREFGVFRQFLRKRNALFDKH